MIKTYKDAVDVVHRSRDNELRAAYQDYVKLHFDNGYLEPNCILSQYRDMFMLKDLGDTHIDASTALSCAEKEVLLEIARRWSLSVEKRCSERSIFARKDLK